MNTKAWLSEIQAEEAYVTILRETEKTIADMKVGEQGYTTAWAFNPKYPVWRGACRTMDTLIERTEDGWDVIETDPGPAAMQEYRRSLLRV